MSYQENSGSNNYIHYIIYTILVVSLFTSILFNFFQDKKPIIEKVEVAKCEKFEDLPTNIQSNFISKEEQLKKDAIYAKNLVTTLSYMNEAPSSPAQPLEHKVQKEEICAKPKNAIKVEDFAKCYNLNEGSYAINNQCRKNIINYVKKHKDAKYFEIIGIVDGMEFKLYKNLEKNDFIYDKLDVNKNYIEKMKKITESGLAKERAIEASWIVKTNTNPKATTYNPHYHITSTKGKRGMIIRAYE